MAINTTFTLFMVIVEIAMIIWGSVVVFGAWASWTGDIEKYENMDDFNYCKSTPMIFAFTILLIKWVSSMEQQDDCLDVTIKYEY